MTAAVARRAEGIVQSFHGLERELSILTDEITTRTANHAPVAADELERWLMRSQNIHQRQQRNIEALNALTRDLDETALTDSVGVFLQGLFQPGIDGIGAAGKEFAAAIITAAAAQRD